MYVVCQCVCVFVCVCVCVCVAPKAHRPGGKHARETVLRGQKKKKTEGPSPKREARHSSSLRPRS